MLQLCEPMFLGELITYNFYTNMAEEEEMMEAGEEADFSKETDVDTDDDISSEDGEPNMELSMREIE